MNIQKALRPITHFLSQPFLIAVSVAALLHSSWSFSTLFGGLEPIATFSGEWFGWFIPGILLAFSVDIGLLSLANNIRNGQRGIGKLTAFAVLCLAMGYLQFCYIATHAPVMKAGPGVRADWVDLVTGLINLSIFILPLLLPVALCLFAFSDSTPSQPHEPIAGRSSALGLVSLDTVERSIEPSIEIECQVDGCDWAGSYKNRQSAENALAAHSRKHYNRAPIIISPNGHERF